MKSGEIYLHPTKVMPQGLKATLLCLDDDMKREVIYLLRESLDTNSKKSEKKVLSSNALEFPKLPKDFQVSKEIKQIGIKFPKDFDYDTTIEEMYQSFAK